jgi:hemolysin activation/secretion protein
MNDLPGVSAKATLERGATPGATRVIIDASEGPLLNATLSADNFGNYYTGVWRGTGQAAINDAFGIGDQLSLSLTGGEGLFLGRASYGLPVGSNGLRANLAFTVLYYEVGRELSSLDSNGRADTINLSASYPLVRSRSASLWGNFSYECRMLMDNANGVKTRDRKVNTGTFDLFSTLYDSIGGGGLTSLRLSLAAGDLNLSGVPTAEAADAAGGQTAGKYVKFGYSAARLQRATERLSLFAAINGQFATSNLDSSEEFILGGPSGVRAYPVGEGSGDEGAVLTFETRYDLFADRSLGNLQLVGFLDAGHTLINRNEYPGGFNNAANSNEYWISGGGAGLNYDKPGVCSIRLSYANKIGHNSGRTVAGKDSDNHNSDGQFWLQAIAWF